MQFQVIVYADKEDSTKTRNTTSELLSKEVYFIKYEFNKILYTSISHYLAYVMDESKY